MGCVWGVSGRFLEGECGRAMNKSGDFLPPASASSSGKREYSYNWLSLSLKVNQLMGVKPCAWHHELVLSD